MSWSAPGDTMRRALGALLVVVASCAGETDARVSASPTGALDDDVTDRSPEEPRDAPPLAEDGLLHPVVMVTIDGVRWQEIFQGTDPTRSKAPPRTAAEIVPNLRALAETRGAALGAPGRGTLEATGPDFLSLPGYTEILTGRTSRSCRDNECPGSDTTTLLDQAHAAGAKVAVFSSWERLERAASVHRDGGQRGFAVSSGRAGAAEITPWPGHGDYRPDKVTAPLALDYLEREQPDVLFVGLGDPDEHAHHGDYDAYVESLSEADAFVGRIVEALGRMGARGARTHLVVTADHGRASDFKNHGGFAAEASRVWLFASGPSIAARGLVRSPAPRHLADVAPTVRAILGLSPDRAKTAGRALDELFVAE